MLVLGVGLGGLGSGVCGCSSEGGSTPVVVESKEDLIKRENTIKELYKARKPATIKFGRR
jgi:hypothetical protein